MPGPARAASAGLARAAGAAADPDPPGVGEPAVRRVPAPLRERLPGPGPFDPQRRGVRALAAVAVPVLVLAAFLAWRARPQVEPAAPATLGAGPVAQAPAPSPSAEQLVVAVAGKVRRPGLVRLPPGARVADAITAAGGPLPGADLSAVNLARRLTDGELVAVGVPGAAEPAGPPGPGPAPAPGGRVNLNTATASQLDALPGVGPVLAQRIVAHREQRGAFRAVSDLRAVDGIGAARFEQLKDLVTV
ncbi:MAG TPA: ComEA family DNA-binding protein [Pilimelia sp.]|nr:ComEA family DNA-binding protein [Pilimelia sp.]